MQLLGGPFEFGGGEVVLEAGEVVVGGIGGVGGFSGVWGWFL